MELTHSFTGSKITSDNSIPFSIQTRKTLDRFANYLYARAGFASGTVDLVTGYARRMAPVVGLNPSHTEVEKYIADLYRSGESYAHLTPLPRTPGPTTTAACPPTSDRLPAS